MEDTVGRTLQIMIEYFGQDRRRVNHSLKVYGYARTIGLREGMPKDKFTVLECASILHDIGIPESLRKYGSSNGQYQERAGARVTEELLSALKCDRDFIDQVVFLVAHHHSYGVDGGISLQILFEADFLVNLDEGNLGNADPRTIFERNFKTKTGRDLMCALYGIEPDPPKA